jgi:hypothetical protein
VAKFIAALIICFCEGFATASPVIPPAESPASSLVFKTSTGFLEPRQWRLGFQSAYGTGPASLVGFDLPALLAGAPNVFGKAEIWSQGPRRVALGVDLMKVDRETLLWGSQKDQFERLDVVGFHPRLIFTQAFSERLLVHSSWEGGFERSKLQLTEKGKRRLWKSKYPKGDYATRDRDGPDGSGSLQENYSVTHRSLLLQSLLGLGQERFEVTGEILRSPRETLVLAAHIARLQLENLEAQRLGFTVSQQWRGQSFGFRAGIGLMYQLISGTDFDDERIDDARFLPLADFDLFLLI